MNANTRHRGSNLFGSLASALMSVLVLFLTPVQAQERPKPGPEQRHLEVWVGEWRYEGVAKATPIAPAGKFAGKQSFRMILGGFFLESRWEDKGDTGVLSQGINIQWYDAASRAYLDSGFENDGSVSPASSTTVVGNVWTGSGIRTDTQGVRYQTKVVSSLATDGRTCATKAELSTDEGKTWVPWWELTMTRISNRPGI